MSDGRKTVAVLLMIACGAWGLFTGYHIGKRDADRWWQWQAARVAVPEPMVLPHPTWIRKSCS